MMRCFQAVVANRPSGSDAGVHHGRPALKAMVMVAVKKIRNAYRRTRAGSFNCREGGMIVDYIVAEQSLIDTTAAEIERGEIVKRAPRPDSGEEPVVPA